MVIIIARSANQTIPDQIRSRALFYGKLKNFFKKKQHLKLPSSVLADWLARAAIPGIFFPGKRIFRMAWSLSILFIYRIVWVSVWLLLKKILLVICSMPALPIIPQKKIFIGMLQKKQGYLYLNSYMS